MGFGGIGPGSLILIAIIVIVLFGTKRLRTIGSDLGSALKGFRKELDGDESEKDVDASEKKSENQHE